MRMNDTSVALSVALAGSFAVVLLPQLTGVAFHEWFGLAVWVALMVHLARRLSAFRMQRRAAQKRGAARAKGRCAVSIALFAALAVCVLSGVMESGEVMRKLGLYSEGFYFWQPLHAFSAKVLLSLLVVHVALHARALSLAVARGFSCRNR